MNRIFAFIIGMVCCLTVMAANPGGGGASSIPRDTCIAVSQSGECYSFINGKRTQYVTPRLKANNNPAKAPHVVGETTYNKLRYSIFDFEEGNGYVATLLGWVDSYDYYSKIVIPNTVPYNGQNVPVTAVNKKAFYGGWGITSVSFGENILGVFDYAFYSCKLTELYIPISMQIIFEGAFMYNPLESVKFEKPNRKNPSLLIYPFAFACLYIRDFQIPARLDPRSYILTDRSRSIKKSNGLNDSNMGDINILTNPFAQNPYLSSFSICEASDDSDTPSTQSEDDNESTYFEVVNDALCVVSGSGDNRRIAIVAYPSGKTDENFQLTDNLIFVNDAAFNITGLKSIKLKSTATSNQSDPKISVYGNAFENNTRLENLSFEASGDVQLPPGMAGLCPNLQNINIGAGVTNYSTIDDVVYESENGAMALVCYPGGKRDEEFVIPDGVRIIRENAMSSNEYVKRVTMPDGLTIIGSQAFLSCTQLSRIDFPSTLETISAYAFYGCSLENIFIPASVKKIYRNAFYTDQNTIRNVTVLCETPPVATNDEVADVIFSPETLETATLILPNNLDPTTFTSYPAWDFKNVQSAGIEDIIIDANFDFYIDDHEIISQVDTPVVVLNISGTIVGKGKEVTITTPGLYIVRQGSKVIKIAIK